MKWYWWLTLPTLLLGSSSQTHLLLEYDSTSLEVLPWSDKMMQRLTPQEVDVLLINLVKQTTSDLRHGALTTKRDLHGTVGHDQDKKNMFLSTWNFENYLYNRTTERYPLVSHINDYPQHQTSNCKGVCRDTVNGKYILNPSVRWNKTMNWNKRNPRTHTETRQLLTRKLATRANSTCNSTLLEDMNGTVSGNHTHTWNNKNFTMKVKKEVYRKLISQALKQHVETHQQIMEIIRRSDFKESIIGQWLSFLTGPKAVHSILHNLQVDTSSNEMDQKSKKHRASRSLLTISGPSSKYQAKNYAKRTPFSIRNMNEFDRALKQNEERVSTFQQHTKRDHLKQHVSKILGKNDLLTLLQKALQQTLDITNTTDIKRYRRSEDGGIMYLPVGGTTKITCPTAADAAGVSISQMAFLTVCLTVFSVIVNISNNINNNNNNNNINSDNNLSNNNAQLSLNINNGAQVNVLLPPPVPSRKKRASFRTTWHDGLLSDTNSTLDHVLQQVMAQKATP